MAVQDRNPSLQPHHVFQRDECRKSVTWGRLPLLNAACKEDAACLGRDFGAINLDVQDWDVQERMSLYDIPNFIQGSILALDQAFSASHFGTVVYGEILEHCPFDAAKRALLQASHVIKPNGRLIVTIPLDSRPKEVQHPPHQLIEWEGGITSWHQTVWHPELFNKLLYETGFEVNYRKELEYPFCKGFGAVLYKVL